jgi:hypothetical protein
VQLLSKRGHHNLDVGLAEPWDKYRLSTCLFTFLRFPFFPSSSIGWLEYAFQELDANVIGRPFVHSSTLLCMKKLPKCSFPLGEP